MATSAASFVLLASSESYIAIGYRVAMAYIVMAYIVTAYIVWPI